jgi:predicted transcriptional regulator
VSETHNLAAQHPDVLARLQRLAEEAHRPAQSGDIYDRALVEKDRNYFEGQTTGKAKAKKGKAKAAAAP